MTAKVLDGKLIASKIRKSIEEEIESLKRQGITPGLAVIIVGDNPASQVYVKNKDKACMELGLHSVIVSMPEDTREDDLLEKIDALNQDKNIHGILVQLPLPRHINTEFVLNKIRPDKDVDGFHPLNVGNLSLGKEGLAPCTPSGIIKMLELSGIPIAGQRVVIIGRSNIVGKPMALLFLARDATVTVCHSRTKDLSAVAREADILVAAIGKAHFITKEMVKPGAVVIDVGINRVDGKLAGDVNYYDVAEVAGAITPVPGGVGPLTIVMLLHNTVQAARRIHGIME